MLTLGDLERAAPAMLPHRSATARPVDWPLLRTELGITFPADYREYVDHYPALSYDGFMMVVVPEPGNESGYVRGAFDTLEMMTGLAERGMTEGYTFHPHENGLFPWGESDEGDLFFWRRSGPDPDGWPAVVHTSNGDWWEHEGGMVSLLVGLIDGSVEHVGLPPEPGPDPTVDRMMPASGSQE